MKVWIVMQSRTIHWSGCERFHSRRGESIDFRLEAELIGDWTFSL